MIKESYYYYYYLILAYKVAHGLSIDSVSVTRFEPCYNKHTVFKNNDGRMRVVVASHAPVVPSNTIIRNNSSNIKYVKFSADQ